MTSALSNSSLPLTYTNSDPLGGIGGMAAVPAYNPFSSGDGSWTPTYDPLLGGFGYTAPGGTPASSLLATGPQALQSQFFFPGAADIGVWNQDPLLMGSSWLMGLDQSQIPVAAGPPAGTSPLAVDGSVIGGAPIDPSVGAIGQSFGGMALNGSVNIVPAGPTILAGQPIVNDSVLSVVMPTPVAPPTQPEKPKSWAAIASQPAKPKPPPPKTNDIFESSKKPQTRTNPVIANGGRGQKKPGGIKSGGGSGSKLDVVSKLKLENNYNPSELTINMTNARFFVIKSYAEDDVHRSIKYNVWCSTDHGNRRLDTAFKEQKSKGGGVYLLFSVNGSGHFCGVAQMMSEVELSTDTGIWTQDKWKGRFDIRWIYVKDVPNNQLRHIRLENNENKPVTNSRDTQEVPVDKGKTVIKIIHSYQHTTSIFDDFEHYEKRQEEDDTPPPAPASTTTSTASNNKKVLLLFLLLLLLFLLLLLLLLLLLIEDKKYKNYYYYYFLIVSCTV